MAQTTDSYPKVDGPVAQANGRSGPSEDNATIPLGLYLWKRIKQVGISSVFGVPGDFNLTLLDHIYDVDGLDWVGNTNELNAAYAADGYARVKGGAGCLVTTHGVGELSALNGIAGSMTEEIKVIHIVGQTSTQMQQNKMMIHHSIGSQPDHQIFNNASRAFRVAAAELETADGAPEEIDRVLRECFVKSKPVYLFVPIDIVPAPVSASRLDTPIDLSPPQAEEATAAATESCLQAIYSAENPAIFVDCLVRQHNAVSELHVLLDKLRIPIFTSNMGKGIVDEDNPCFVGVYNGVASHVGMREVFEGCDLMLVIGDLPSDTNTGGFTRKIAEDTAIYINSATVSIKGGKTYSGTPIKSILQSLASRIDPAKVVDLTMPALPPRPREDDLESKAITQSWVWHRLAQFLERHDVLLGETGTAAFGVPDSAFPPGVQWITQTYYGSIGYATPAALGADLALRELSSAGERHSPRGRTLLVTGDGSMMLTVQEVGNMVKQGLRTVIFVINNAGYTIERVIHGAHMSYNDIVPFRYERMLDFFGAAGPHESTQGLGFHRAATKADLDAVLCLESVRRPGGVQVVEIVMDKMDVPWRLSTQIATRGPEAVREMEAAGFKVRQMGKYEGFWK